MKNILFLFLITTMGCTINFGTSSNNSESDDQHDHQGKEYTSAYICPMHCESSGSDTTGNCPVCGMDYVKNTDNE